MGVACIPLVILSKVLKGEGIGSTGLWGPEAIILFPRTLSLLARILTLRIL